MLTRPPQQVEVRLSESTADALPSAPPPGYDRAALRPGIVHLGLGAFYRAHGLVYTHRALGAMPAGEAAKWGVVGVSMRSEGVAAALGPQGGLYTVHEATSAAAQPSVLLVGCLLRCLVCARDPSAVLELLASPDVRVVSLTVTEKGYCYDPATRALDLANLAIAHDLDPANARAPTSAVGLLVRALAARRAAGLEPFSCVSCDNLPENGRTLRALCAAFARALEGAPSDAEPRPAAALNLAGWIEASVPFPCTMVDRIVPAVRAADVERAAQPGGPLGGLRDEGLVSCEPFRQWVLEDVFGPLGRPAWELAGAQLVPPGGVAAFENLKLRLLNGCHSALAYLGALCGAETIADAMDQPALARVAAALLELDAIPALEPPEGVDASAYAATVLGRFRNRLLGHRCAQVAMDGSQKLPQRLLASARARLAAAPAAAGGSEPALRVLPLAVAAWIAFATRLDEDGRPVRVQDPLADRFAEIALGPREPAALASRMLGLREVFGSDGLAADPRFAQPVAEHLGALMAAGTPEGALAYVRAFADGLPPAALLGAPGWSL